MVVRYPVNLNVSEPNNNIGLLKIRQSDEETQTLVVQILEDAVPKSYEGLQVFFCARIGQTAGLGIIEQKLLDSEMTDPKNGKLEYTFRAEDWQVLGRQNGYFSFRKMKDDHTYVQQFSTRDFTYEVTKSIYSDGIKELKKDGSTYIWTFEDLLRLLEEFKESGETDFLTWFDEIKDQLSEDAAGNLLLLYQSLRDKTGLDTDFRGFEPEESYMSRVNNEMSERGLNIKTITDYTSFFSSTDEIDIFITTDMVISGDLTIPENFTLNFTNDAKIIVAENTNLTLNAKIKASSRKIFDIKGTLQGNPNKGVGFVEWFGKSETDDTQYFQQAVNIFKRISLIGTYKVTSVQVPTGRLIRGVFGYGFGMPVIQHLDSNLPALISNEGFDSSCFENFAMTGGTPDTFGILIKGSIFWCKNILFRNYRGNGIKTEDGTSGGGWSARLDHVTFTGLVTNGTSDNTEQIAVCLASSGGNIIIDKCNIRRCTKGILIQTGDQVTVSNCNLSEINNSYFPNADGANCRAIDVKSGNAISIENNYIENMNLGVYVAGNSQQITIANCYMNNLSRPQSIVTFEGSGVDSVVVQNCKLIAQNSNGKEISLYNSPTNVKIINSLSDTSKLTNNALVPFILEKGTSISGNYSFKGVKNPVDTWGRLNGQGTSGSRQLVGDGLSINSFSGTTYTSDGVLAGGQCLFILPSVAQDGAEITFVKRRENSSCTMIIQPTSANYIYPRETDAIGKGFICNPGQTGSLTLQRQGTGWAVTSKIGNWTEQ